MTLEPPGGCWLRSPRAGYTPAWPFPHRTFIPDLVDRVASQPVDPDAFITQSEPMRDVLAAFRTFDRREPGWVKVTLDPIS